MSIQLILPADLEERLKQEAGRRGVSPAAAAVQLLEQHLPPLERAAQLQALFAQWEAEDQAKGDEAPDSDLYKALDAARPSYRKLFPDELKGISW